MPTQKSFSKGDAFPSLAPGTLRIYSMRFCPYAQRTLLVLLHKNIQFETINVNLKQKPDWFLERNPKGLVPMLEMDDKVLYESLITSEYLDEVYPQNRLTPMDPYKKARNAMLVDFYGNKFITNYYKSLRSEGKDEEAKEALTSAMQKLEEEIAACGTFFGGDKLAMVDLMIWPWIERTDLWKTIMPSMVLSESTFPKLFTWKQAMMELPAVKALYHDPETHMKFMLSYVRGTPDYDLGLEAGA